jgi:hypothetical protein
MRLAVVYLLLPGCILTLALSQTGCEPVRPDAKAARNSTISAVEPVLAQVPDIVIPAGTLLRVRLDHALSTVGNRSGDRFTGSLAEPVAPGGQTALPRGAAVTGLVRQSAPSGRLKGRAVLALAADSVELDGRIYGLATSPVVRTSDGHKKRNWTILGGGSGAGALIGGLAGGWSGAAIGAGAGAAAGTAGAALSGRKQVGLPAESVVTFRLNLPLAIKRST